MSKLNTPKKEDFEDHPEVPRKKRKIRLESDNFIAMLKTRWKPGKPIVYRPKDIKSEICISRGGCVYYRQKRKLKWVYSKNGERLYRRVPL